MPLHLTHVNIHVYSSTLVLLNIYMQTHQTVNIFLAPVMSKEQSKGKSVLLVFPKLGSDFSEVYMLSYPAVDQTSNRPPVLSLSVLVTFVLCSLTRDRDFLVYSFPKVIISFYMMMNLNDEVVF